ncbi:MAG: Holliday junction resolvase RuvX [Desulfovibrio sp.]|jgi:putative Holliday junction resolvase|nr:Holliday junction resolvase RuvX [Desulfovibrio sp.]
MRYLAVDYGEKRSGLALSDSVGTGVFPRPVLNMRGPDDFTRAICELVRSEEVGALVLGLPLYLNGEHSVSTKRVLTAVRRLRAVLHLPIYLMPETLSSYDAEDRLREAGLKGKNLRKALDGAAAAVILESFFNLIPEHRDSLLFDENREMSSADHIEQVRA